MTSRANLAERQTESWRPPSFSASNGLLARIKFGLRRLFDLQTGSIWNDLSVQLPAIRGAVADAGCGAQPYRILFHKDVEYIGLDTPDAKANFGYGQLVTRHFQGTTWPLADSSIQCVLCTETLEHVINPQEFLEEAIRCLACSGKLILTVPFAARWHYIPHDYWRFTPSSLNHLLRKAGFTQIAVYARGNALTVACYKNMALIVALLMPQGKPFVFSLALRIVGVCFLPLFLFFCCVGNLSLLGQGGDDCLGYTVFAQKPGEPAPGNKRDAGEA